jgi:hypothetical protein
LGKNLTGLSGFFLTPIGESMKELVREALDRFTKRSLENRPRLLQENRKLSLWDGGGKYLIRGLSLAPGKTSGHNVCEFMGACFASCIGYWNGFQNMNTIRAAEIARTRYAIEHPARFRNQLDWELDKLATSAKRKGLSPLVRLNVFSDLDWQDVIADWQDCRFFDYTKHLGRIRHWLKNGLPENYSVTLSHSERLPWQTARAWLARGHNVSVVYYSLYNSRVGEYGELPSKHYYAGQWRNIVNGDTHDIRIPEFDGIGNIVGLRFKSNGSKLENTRHAKSRFVMSTSGKNFEWGTV